MSDRDSAEIVNADEPGAPERPRIDARAVWRLLAPILAGAGMLLLVGAFLLAAGALQQATSGLGVLFKIDPFLATLTAWAVTVAFIGHCLLAAFAGSNALKFWNGVSAVLWLLIVMCLTATYSILRLVGINEGTSFEQMQQLLAMGGAVVSTDLLTIGRLAYAVLIALALCTLTVSIFGAMGMRRQIDDTIHKTMGHVAASSGVNIVIVAAAAFSGLHMFTYGGLIGADVFTSAVSAVLAELTFIAASKRAMATRKAYYVLLAVGSIGYAMLVNWLEGRALGAAAGIYDVGARALAVEQFVRGDVLARTASDLYSIAGPMFALAWVVLEFFTSRAGEAAAVDHGQVEQPHVLARIAGTVRTTRHGAREIARAWRGDRQLPEPASIPHPATTLAMDAPLPERELVPAADQTQQGVTAHPKEATPAGANTNTTPSTRTRKS